PPRRISRRIAEELHSISRFFDFGRLTTMGQTGITSYMNANSDTRTGQDGADARSSCADDVFRWVVARIGSGEWRPGTVVPSERQLVEQLGVSRVPVREALSMLKSLGIIEIHQGRRSVVRQMDTGMLQQLFPLIFRLEGQESFVQIFDLRLA